jgi:hypothetical protein
MPRRAGDLPHEPPKFFAERSLGGRDVAERLRAAGWNAQGWLEIYPDREDERMADELWIPAAVARGCVLLTTNHAMLESEVITATMVNNQARVFWTHASLSAEETARLYAENQDGVYRRTTLPGPFFFALGKDARFRRREL